MKDCLRYVASQKDIIIYGTGKIGIMVYNILEENGLQNKIRYFVATGAQDGMLKEIPVIDIYKLKKEEFSEALFLIGVSDKYVVEIKEVLKELQVKKWLDGKKLYTGKYQKNFLKKKLLKLKGDWYQKREKLNFDAENKESVAHITYCFVNNAGDTMLSKCVRKTINAAKYEIINVAKKVDDEVLEQINQCDYMVLGGGGLFLPDTNANKVSGWQWAISKEQLEQIKVPVIIYSVGYNFFKGQKPDELFCDSVIKLVEKASFVGLRNHGSVEAIKEIVPKELQDKIVYQPCTTTVIQKLYGFEKENNSRIVGLNMAFDREEQRYGKEKTEVLTKVARAVKQIENMGYEIRYIAHCDTDLRFLPYLDKADVRYKVEYLVDSLPQKIIDCYKKVELMLGMRGHAQMIPFGVGCRVISLGTHDKLRWFLEDINADDWYVNLNEDIEHLTENILYKFEKISRVDSVETDRRLKEAQEELWQITCKNRTAIFKEVGKYI